MAQDPAAQPHPRPKDADERRNATEAGPPASHAPDDVHDMQLDDEKAARALKKIEEVRRKLEPRG